MRTRTPTQDVIAHGVSAGDRLVRTDENGNETIWRVLDVSIHPERHDHLLLSSGDGSGYILDAHLSDWVRRVIEP